MAPTADPGPGWKRPKHYTVGVDGGVAEAPDNIAMALHDAMHDPRPIQLFDGLNHRVDPAVVQGAQEVYEAVDHPKHYGGRDSTYEAIKVIEAWELDFNLGNVVKYISRADYKGSALQDLQKARWYLDREIQLRAARVAARAGAGQGSRT